MTDRKFEFLIVGSGAGGATLAKELSKRGKEVLVVEKGKLPKKLGSLQAALGVFDATPLKMPRQSKEGVVLWRAFSAGGSTVYSAETERCV